MIAKILLQDCPTNILIREEQKLHKELFSAGLISILQILEGCPTLRLKFRPQKYPFYVFVACFFVHLNGLVGHEPRSNTVSRIAVSLSSFDILKSRFSFMLHK